MLLESCRAKLIITHPPVNSNHLIIDKLFYMLILSCTDVVHVYDPIKLCQLKIIIKVDSNSLKLCLGVVIN